MRSEMAVELATNVWRIPVAPMGLINIFALRDDDGGITFVDAGTGSALTHRKIIGALEFLGSSPADVRRIVITHAHSDQVGGLAALARLTNANIAAHERESVYLREGRIPQLEKGPSTRNLLQRVSRRALRRFTGRKFSPVTVAEEFRDGMILPIAGGTRVIHTPGHTPGHVSLLHERSGVLFTGDAVVNVRGLRFPSAWLCTDGKLARRSGEALGDANYEVAAFSHGEEIRHQAREAIRALAKAKSSP